MAPNQTITLSRPGLRKEAIARVVGQTGIRLKGHIYGVQCVDSNANIWGIAFPPVPEASRAASRVLLRCPACRATEVAYLDEIESDVFHNNGYLLRACKHCSDWTRWTVVPADGEAGNPEPAVRSSHRTANRRKHIRLKTKMVACIRDPGAKEDVVPVADVSRGGIRFFSQRKYHPGAWIEVSVPYTRDTANIFVPGRIAWATLSQPGGFHEYGVRYIGEARKHVVRELAEV